MEVMPSYRDSLQADIQPSYTDSLMHHGVKGMKWGYHFASANGNRTAQTSGPGAGYDGYYEDPDNPRKTSDIPDDGRRVKSFKDLWYDSSNYVKVHGHKIKKDEGGEAFTRVGKKFIRGKSPQAVARKADKEIRRIQRHIGM